MAKTHPAYVEEKSHLITTIDTVNKLEVAGRSMAQEAKMSIAENSGLTALRNLSVTQNWYLQHTDKLIATYDNIRKEAYHGRIDFSDGSSNAVETIYIGKCSLRDEKSNVLIVDWREPINDLFMSGASGSSSYQDNLGNIVHCKLYLKRVLKVMGQEITALNDEYRADGYGGDSNTMAGDPYLLQILKQASSNRLRDIVATIQQEQNEIIRAPMDSLLVVQGVAGSGKTTVVLHRLAYLLYAHRKEVSPEQMLIIAPNKVFLSYISEVLPGLGYKNLSQLTLEDFLLTVVNQKLKVRSREDQHAILLGANPEEGPEETLLTLSALTCQSRVTFTDILDGAIAAAIQSAIPQASLVVDGQVLMTASELQHRYAHDYVHLPPAQRLEQLKAAVEKVVQKYGQERAKKINDDFDPLFYHARGISGQQKQQWMDRILKERDALLATLDTSMVESWQAYRVLFRNLDSVRIYRQLLSSVHMLWTYNQGKQGWNELYALAVKKQTPGKQELDREDLACIAYISYKIKGFAHSYKHVAMDEGQDLSPLEFHILHAIIGHSSMTIVGDINQSFYPGRLLPSWPALFEDTVPSDGYRLTSLSSSYRTTEQIAILANSILQSPHFAAHELTPIPRSGPNPMIEHCPSSDDRLTRIVLLLGKLAGKHHNIGVVTRTLREAEELHTYIKAQGIIVTLLDAESQDYSGGVQVMPVNMAKGLELDVIILSNASETQYPDVVMSARLFYVAITRAMHELYIYYEDKLTPLLKLPTAITSGPQDVASARLGAVSTVETQALPETLTREVPKPPEQIFNLTKWLASHNCRTTYDKAGALWLLGGLEHKALMTEAGKSGFRFVYAHRGSEATEYKPGWMLPKKR